MRIKSAFSQNSDIDMYVSIRYVEEKDWNGNVISVCHIETIDDRIGSHTLLDEVMEE